MAPTATSTVTEPRAFEAIADKTTFGSYKEQTAGARSYNKQLEEEGDEKNPRAKVYSASLI